jgi:taurine dioxygenase
MTNMTISIKPLTPAIGSTICGVDLSKLDDDTFAEIQATLFERCMLVIPDQQDDDATLLSFAERWGDIMFTPMLTSLNGYPGILQVRNRGKSGTPTEYWHSDSPYLKHPPAISILAARELPASGGDTMWCNQYLAYEALSDGMKALLEGRRVKYSGAKMAKRTGHEGDIPFTLHPAVRTHPKTGRKALFIGNAELTPCFEDMTEKESRPLLDYLYRQSPNPDRTYRHSWKLGDVVLWDNQCAMHYAVHDYGEAARFMHRITIAGERPY